MSRKKHRKKKTSYQMKKRQAAREPLPNGLLKQMESSAVRKLYRARNKLP